MPCGDGAHGPGVSRAPGPRVSKHLMELLVAAAPTGSSWLGAHHLASVAGPRHLPHPGPLGHQPRATDQSILRIFSPIATVTSPCGSLCLGFKICKVGPIVITPPLLPEVAGRGGERVHVALEWGPGHRTAGGITSAEEKVIYEPQEDQLVVYNLTRRNVLLSFFPVYF